MILVDGLQMEQPATVLSVLLVLINLTMDHNCVLYVRQGTAPVRLAALQHHNAVSVFYCVHYLISHKLRWEFSNRQKLIFKPCEVSSMAIWQF